MMCAAPWVLIALAVVLYLCYETQLRGAVHHRQRKAKPGPWFNRTNYVHVFELVLDPAAYTETGLAYRRSALRFLVAAIACALAGAVFVKLTSGRC